MNPQSSAISHNPLRLTNSARICSIMLIPWVGAGISHPGVRGWPEVGVTRVVTVMNQGTHEMKSEIEGLPELPEPEFLLRWDSQRAAYYVSKPQIGDIDVYTADQMRAYAQAAIAKSRESAPVEYERELIADMLDDLCAKVPNSDTKFSHWSIQEMARLLREADNRDSQARTVCRTGNKESR
jgi:hypothetical protein